MPTLKEQWALMGRSGLLSVGLPSRFGGQGGGAAEVWRTARRVGRTVPDLGMGLSWVIHHVTSRFHIGTHGTDEQKAAWLPRLASGESVAAIAWEEELGDAGPLQATAIREDYGMWVLNGTKVAVINAPVADLLVVGAVTPTDEQPDATSAFLVHRDTPGVQLGPSPDRLFCPSSPHANVGFLDCRIPPESLLGDQGQAVSVAAVVGEQFDILVLQVICGYLGSLLDEVDPQLRESATARLTLLTLTGRHRALQLLNGDIADRWDQRTEEPERFVAAQAAARELIELTRADLAKMPEHPSVAAAQRDLELITLGWPNTRRRFLAAVRNAERAPVIAP